MSQAKKGKLNYRCPQCFARDLDMDLFYDEEKDEYYCLRCCFHGDEKRILELNEDCKKKYGLIDQRIDDLGEDNVSFTHHTHKKGEF